MEQRKILFKAKRTDIDEWVEGYYYNNGPTHYIIISNYESDDYGFPFEVDPSTVCQFTGLKDKNGVEIWEGDIVDFIGEGEVLFKNGAFYVKFAKYAECLLSTLIVGKPSAKVIGSKFDRKEGEK